MKRILCALILLLGLAVEGIYANNEDYAAKSVLDSGKWVKIRVSETGVYRLSASDIKKMGFSNSSNVAVYGYGGWMVDEDFSSPYIDDLPEVATLREGGDIIFYARGPLKWEYNESRGFIRTNNPYSLYGYYFVTQKQSEPKAIQQISSVPKTSVSLTSFDDYYLWEKELYSVNSSGRELYGESFEYTTSQDFSVSIPGITSEDAKVRLEFIAKSSSLTTASLSIGGASVVGCSMSPSSATYTAATTGVGSALWRGDKPENFKVNIKYSSPNQKNARLNYFLIQSKRTLKNYGAFTCFRSLASINNASEFTVAESNSSTIILDVTDPLNAVRIESSLDGSNLRFGIEASSELKEFVAIQPSQLKSPTIVGAIENQNLHALEQQDMIIIAQPAFTTQAERIAEVHRLKDNLKVKVIEPEKIYNEFSSGTPDASAFRRFMKMFYDRKTSEADAPKYLLLFGDGSYDNRQLTSNWKQVDMSNMLITYQTENSLTETSYVVDDYFGFLDNAWNNKPQSIKNIQLGIGRFPVRTVSEATKVVDKVLTYIDNENCGSWKNQLCFMADDGSNSDGYTTQHMKDADALTTYIGKNHPEFITNKLYFDAYKKDHTGGQNGYPDVKIKLQKLLKDGLLVLNYVGHGNTSFLSDEKVITQTEISQSGYTRLPVWITATCDFARFDDLTTSAGEDVLFNQTSGGIALFTTTRVAYMEPNKKINASLIYNLFEKKDGKRRTLGEVMRETKNSLTSDYKQGFCLLGDPALRLAYPEYGMRVTKVNGQDAYGEAIPFRALDKVTIEGVVTDGNGKEATTYKGMLYATVKDSRVTVTCLNNNNSSDAKFQYTDYPNTIFTGNDSIKDGKFKFTFTVPKDISYANLFGKMNLYAYSSDTRIEAQGNYENFIVGGSVDDVEEDTKGPEIRQLFLNDSTFTDGAKVNTTPFFVARLWDESGVSVSGSSVGHDMMLIIDDNISLAYNLNSYYAMVPGSDGEGLVKFSIPKLSLGKHTAEFWAWDIFNNSTVHTFTFEVEEGLKPFLFDVSAAPIPARDNLTFYISHDRPESRMKVSIMVYDLTGRLLWTHREEGSSQLFENYQVSWNLTKSGGISLRPGVYLYRAAISTDNSKEASKTKKLIILGR